MLQNKNWLKTVRRPYPPLFASLIVLGASQKQHYVGLVDKPLSTQNKLLVDGVWYYDKEEVEEMSRVVFKSWIQPNKLLQAKKIFEEREQKLLTSAAKDGFETFCRAYEVYMPAITLVWRADEPVEKHIRELLFTKLSNDKAEELLNILNIPEQDNYHIREEYDLVHTNDIAAHVKKYEWIKSRYGAIDPYTIGEAEQKLKEINKEKFLESYRKRKESVHAAVAYAKDLLGDNAPIVDLMQYVVYYRTQRTDVVNRAQYMFARELKNLASRYDLSYEEILYVLKTEIDSILPSKEEIRSRMKGYVVMLNEGAVACVSGNKIEEIRTIVQENTENVSQVSGAIAFKGSAIGKVRLIYGTEDFGKVQEKDILVTSMTNPHMIPIMKKAAAFVTDEGGITCHAAVIAREMQKPCVIGTRNATQIFKDGDEVEVDAEKGIVRKV